MHKIYSSWSIAKNEQSIITVCCMMDAFVKNSLSLKCIQLFKDLVMNTTNNSSIKPNNICYSILFTAIVNANAWHLGNVLQLLHCLNTQKLLKSSSLRTTASYDNQVRALQWQTRILLTIMAMMTNP